MLILCPLVLCVLLQQQILQASNQEYQQLMTIKHNAVTSLHHRSLINVSKWNINQNQYLDEADVLICVSMIRVV
jgi:hypothetical protein